LSCSGRPWARWWPRCCAAGSPRATATTARTTDPDGGGGESADELSRRDLGLEFLDVFLDARRHAAQLDPVDGGRGQEDVYQITNTSSSVVDTYLLLIAQGLTSGVHLEGASGTTRSGAPYRREYPRNGVLLPGERILQTLRSGAPSSSMPGCGDRIQLVGLDIGAVGNRLEARLAATGQLERGA